MIRAKITFMVYQKPVNRFRVFLPIPPKRGNKQITNQVIPETEPVPELLHPC
jgi:hypothetical protein